MSRNLKMLKARNSKLKAPLKFSVSQFLKKLEAQSYSQISSVPISEICGFFFFPTNFTDVH